MDALDRERAKHVQAVELLDAEVKRQAEALWFGSTEFVTNTRADEHAKQVANLTRKLEDARKEFLTYVEQVSSDKTIANERISNLEDMCYQVAGLISDSYGIDGLHLNGDVAPWESLLPGGYFEQWLSAWTEERMEEFKS
jgi:hypothetical protein